MIRTTLSAVISASLLLAPASMFAAAPPSDTQAKAASIKAARLRLPVTRQSRRIQRERIAQQRAKMNLLGRAKPPRTIPATTKTQPTPAGSVDPQSDTTVRSQLLLLNKVSPMLAGVTVFSNQEAIDVDEIRVKFTGEVQSVSQALVYDGEGVLLATATLDTTDATRRTYRATLPTGKLQIPYRKNANLYVRARLKDEDSGGVSGEDIQVDLVDVRGNGAWSNESYTKQSTETFSPFQSARARIVSVVNTGGEKGILPAGNEQLIGQFRFTAEESDSSAAARVTDLTFTVESFGGLSVNSVLLRREGSNNSFACSTAGSTITCSGITAEFGEIDTDPLNLRVYANVVIPVSTNDMFLRLTLNDPGTPTSAGAITWTDGTASFSWVGMDSPIVRGTALER